jgi:hypothetical protein
MRKIAFSWQFMEFGRRATGHAWCNYTASCTPEVRAGRATWRTQLPDM